MPSHEALAGPVLHKPLGFAWFCSCYTYQKLTNPQIVLIHRFAETLAVVRRSFQARVGLCTSVSVYTRATRKDSIKEPTERQEPSASGVPQSTKRAGPRVLMSPISFILPPHLSYTHNLPPSPLSLPSPPLGAGPSPPQW